MVAKRLVAVVVAVALVVAAVYVRRNLAWTLLGDSGGGTPAAGRPNGSAADADVPDGLRLLCVEELEAACDALAEAGASVTVEPAGATLAALAEADADATVLADVWLTVAPLPDVALLEGQAAGMNDGLGPASGVLAQSPVAVVVRDDRLDVLEAFCGGEVTWPCIGEAAPQRWADLGGRADWGPVKVTHASPERSAAGLLTIAEAAAGFIGDVDFSRQDLDGAEFFGWFSSFQRAVVAPPPDPVQQIVVQRASLDIVGTLEAVAEPRLATAQGEGLVVRNLEPSVVANVVAMGIGADGAAAVEEVAGPAQAALTAAGWHAPDATAPAASAPSSGTPPSGAVTGDNGVPAAGALVALREMWSGVK